MFKAAQAVERLSGSQRASQIATWGTGAVSLASGDPSFATPDYISEAAIAAIREGHTHYAPPMGIMDLRRTVARQLSAKDGGDFQADDILITPGSSAGIYAAMVAYLDPGDEVLLHDPSYSLYRDVALAIGAQPVFVPWTKDFRLDLEALERAVTPRTRMFVLNNPVNPTGVVLSPSETAALAEFVRRHDLLLLADEAYDHLVYDGREMLSVASIEALADRAIILNTCSKTFAMTGWRIGYVAARQGLVRPVAVIHRTAFHSANTIAQRAAVTAFSEETDWHERMLAAYTERREIMCNMVNEMPGLHCERPEGAFYVFVRVDVPLSSQELTDHCFRHGVEVRSGTEFGQQGEGYIRLTFAGAPAEFRPGLERMAEAMQAL